MTSCRLCDLPTGDEPVTDPAVDGEFCCPGCLAVQRELGGLDEPATDDAASEREVPPDAETAYLAVGGMHCTTCETFLERIGERSTGVHAVDASYAAETLRVTYDPEEIDRNSLADRFTGWGYEARQRADGDRPDHEEDVGRLLVGGFFGMMAMAMYALFVYPRSLGLEPVVTLGTFDGLYLYGHLWTFATVVLLYTGRPILRGALVSLRAGRPNVDLLVSLAAVAAYCYSTGIVLAGGTEPYFDVTIVIVLAVSIGRYYEGRVKRRVAGTLADLTALQVDDARLAPDGRRVPVETVEADDELLVRPGERVPVDGTVRKGTAAVDEALVTGKALPRQVEPGDDVRGGTVVQDASLTVVASEGAESTLDRIAELLWDVQSTRPGAQRLADRLATVFVPLVLATAAVAVLGSLAVGVPARGAILTGLGVLVVSCPCALGLATPLAVAAGVSAAADRGVIFATPALVEGGSSVDAVVLDMTGTLTDGEMSVRGLRVPAEDEAAVRRRASALEANSSHPIAEAVAAAGDGSPAAVMDFERFPRGVTGRVDGERVVVGHPEFCRDRGIDIGNGIQTHVDDVRPEGHVPVVVGWAGRARGVFAVGDRPRPGWPALVERLATDLRVIVLSGDEGAGTAPFAAHPAVDEVFAGIPPEGKAATIRRLQADETVAMVGDGSNDAPALAAADVGVALENGTELASDAADAVVTGDDLSAVPTVFAVADATRRRIRGNLAWAFCYNAVAIPLAVAGLINPLFAGVAMATSSILVVANSARPVLSESTVESDVEPAGPHVDGRPAAAGTR